LPNTMTDFVGSASEFCCPHRVLVGGPHIRGGDVVAVSLEESFKREEASTTGEVGVFLGQIPSSPRKRSRLRRRELLGLLPGRCGHQISQ
jgi:hypothetical protein